jgi:hypothetical protein
MITQGQNFRPVDNRPHLDCIERLIEAYGRAKNYGAPADTLDAISAAIRDSAASFKLAYVCMTDVPR